MEPLSADELQYMFFYKVTTQDDDDSQNVKDARPILADGRYLNITAHATTFDHVKNTISYKPLNFVNCDNFPEELRGLAYNNLLDRYGKEHLSDYECVVTKDLYFAGGASNG